MLATKSGLTGNNKPYSNFYDEKNQILPPDQLADGFDYAGPGSAKDLV
jgi:hypothetical protein